MRTAAQIARELFGDSHPCACGGGHEICLKCNVCRAHEPDRLFSPSDGLASAIDATILKADAKEEDIRALCNMANHYRTASVCINSQFIELINKLLEDSVRSCTVINFPLGAGSVEAISGEAKAVILAGVDEVDMVQNLAALRSGQIETAYESILRVAEECQNQTVLLKVILETCFLDREQIIVSCLLAKKAGAHFVKTSTGFGSAGATEEHIALMREVVGPKLGVKASGGVRTKEQALAMIAAGANRIGASNAAAIVED
jgi:deoxyribose-phosphate aldolase